MRFLLRFHSGHNQLVVITLSLSIVISLISIALFFFGPPQIPLWYTLTLPQEQLASREWSLAVAGLAWLIALSSLWFGRQTKLEHERYVAGLSLWSGISLLGLLFVALARILKVIL